MRLIDADTLRECFETEYKTGEGIQVSIDRYALKCIDNTPTVDPVKHGRWEARWNTLFKAYLPCCSVCSKSAVYTFDYCPNCGALMDGENDAID